MNDIFYYNWLFTMEESDKYKEPIEFIALSREGFEKKSEPAPMQPGFRCRYVNPLRNGNCLRPFTLRRDREYTIESISDLDVISLYTCGDKILAAHLGAWALYDPLSYGKIAGDTWSGDGGSFFSEGERCLIYDNTLQEFTSSGKIVNNTVITLPPGIGMHEIARVGDVTIIDAFVTPHQFHDEMPERLRPCGFLQAVKADGFTPPHGKFNLKDISKSATLAFVEDNVIIPVYLDSVIIQPLTDGIALLSYDLKILRVLQGKFRPHFTSAAQNGTIYLAAVVNNKEQLMGIAQSGRLIFTSDIPPGFGESACPPMVSSNGNIYWIGNGGFLVFDETGEQVMMDTFSSAGVRNISAVLYKDILAVSAGNEILVYNELGRNIMRIGEFSDDLTTPLVTDGNDNYFAGTARGLFAIRQK